MELMLFAYPARLRKGPDGRFSATFRDLPEALTDGADKAEALTNAADALSEALMGRIADGELIPTPSKPRRGECQIPPEPTIAAKAALHHVVREDKVTAAQLARLLEVDHKEARRILAPDHKTKLPRLAEALRAVGQNVAIAVYGLADESGSIADSLTKQTKSMTGRARSMAGRRKTPV